MGWRGATSLRVYSRAHPMKLQSYIFKQLLVGLAMAVAGILFVALPGIAVSTVHRMPNADGAILLR